MLTMANVRPNLQLVPRTTNDAQSVVILDSYLPVEHIYGRWRDLTLTSEEEYFFVNLIRGAVHCVKSASTAQEDMLEYQKAVYDDYAIRYIEINVRRFISDLYDFLCWLLENLHELNLFDSDGGFNYNFHSLHLHYIVLYR